MTLGRKKFRDLTKKLTDQEFLSQCQKSIPDLDVEALKTWLRKRRSQRRKVSEHSCAEWIRDNKKKSSNAALYGQMLKIVSAKEKCCSDDGRALKRQRLKLQQRQKQQKQQKQDHTSLPGNHFNWCVTFLLSLFFVDLFHLLILVYLVRYVCRTIAMQTHSCFATDLETIDFVNHVLATIFEPRLI